MFWQREYIREAVSMTLNSTYRLDLPENGNLGSILLRVSGSQASGFGQDGGDWRILDKISKIELIGDGSTIIKSLKGDAIQALAFYDQKVSSPDAWKNYSTNTQWAYFLINFGKELYDSKLGLDLSKFQNVELRIENEATSSHFSDLTVSVLGFYLRDTVSPPFTGFVRSEEWRSWTTVQDETKYLTLPTELVIRRIILQAIPGVDSDNVENTNMSNLMDDVNLSLKTGEVGVYKGGIDDIMRSNIYEYKAPVIVGGSHYMNVDKGVNVSLGYTLFGAWGAGSQDGAGAATIATMETGRTSFTQKPETYEADSPMGIIFSGIAYHNTLVFKFDHDPDTGLWLDPNLKKDVLLNIHTRNAASSASGTNKVLLDRYVRY